LLVWFRHATEKEARIGAWR
jgi:uncharacterized protein (DUF433 family)